MEYASSSNREDGEGITREGLEDDAIADKDVFPLSCVTKLPLLSRVADQIGERYNNVFAQL